SHSCSEAFSISCIIRSKISSILKQINLKKMETTESTYSTLSSLVDKGKLFFKAVIIFVMAFFLWIPTNIIREVINEREGRQKEAIEEVSSKWAGKQTITGPILMIPYTGTVNGLVNQKKYAWFMADQLDISSSVSPQKRHRGIYEVVVYQGDISITEIGR